MLKLNKKPFILQEDERDASAVPPQFAVKTARSPKQSFGFRCNGLPVPVYFPGWISSARESNDFGWRSQWWLSAKATFSGSFLPTYSF
jgi:hypothetical protein